MKEEKKIEYEKDALHCHNNYESKLLECNTLIKCHSKGHNSTTPNGALMVKIPVVLSQFEVEITLDEEVELKKGSTYVKAESKHTVITDCNVIPYTNNLFIEGYVQKYIEFYENGSVQGTASRQELKYTTINLPFKAVTGVPFEVEPIYGNTIKRPVEVLKNIGLDKETIEHSWFYYNKPQEQVYFEIDWVKILETNITNSPCLELEGNKKQEEPQKVLIKMALHIGLKVLQNQPMYIAKIGESMAMIEEKCNSSREEHIVNEE